ncbi:hypothetical protein AQUSIP_22110 [Aquicella siphonis]|uniref:Uncharacterized protein n=1 Tax=Aquicella siphonis TaxID=254247 RepID=A0A5E4PIV6_9COXI|nr:hypothetical protein [Aquicella siphonis]VVC76884.1 hypothetical protein AQUSIP_22110 [Aquicella siphonis]
MPYITREDGEHFVIPSYRDVLTIKQKSQLKKEILLLSQSYGEYITLQKKAVNQYEVAFSPDTGYLLGESIWHHFNKPLDLIYCEAIPNTTEAILVIVKSGSVYLDGSFPLDSIPEELIIFLTQQNNFEIYVYGDVPISKEPEAGKFSFEASSVKSYNVLDKPIFPTLPLMKTFQLQLVDAVLKEQGIGVVPVKPIIIGLAVIGVAFIAWNFYSSRQVVTTTVAKPQVNPYQQFLNTLSSPAPDQEVTAFIDKLQLMSQMPGWSATDVKYIHNGVNATVYSYGGKVEDLYAWAAENNANVMIKKTGIFMTIGIKLPNRPAPTKIYSSPKIIATIVDRLSNVYPGNNLDLGDSVRKGVYTDTIIKIRFNNIGPVVLDLIGKQFADLPVVIHDITVRLEKDFNLTGSITIEALGN